MTHVVAGTRRIGRVAAGLAPLGFLPAGLLLPIWFLLSACGTAGPPLVTYVLGPPPRATNQTEPVTGRPVLEVKRVVVPDYLDVTDIMVRSADNVVAPSTTGKWGERLSVGVSRALAIDLQARLPGAVVSAVEPVETPAMQILVDVEAFEPKADGSVVLAANWRLVDPGGRATLAGARVSLTAEGRGVTDAAIAACMTQAIEDLSARIAPAVRDAIARRPVR